MPPLGKQLNINGLKFLLEMLTYLIKLRPDLAYSGNCII
jgi:hypothetical protein